MELLIPGLILVALMVWASTKIKKSAAAAYAEETFSADGFTINKPDGFIIPLNEDSPVLFEARTKEHENIGRETVPQASAVINGYEGEDFDEVCERIRTSADTAIGEDKQAEGSRVCVIDAEETENEISYASTYKVIELPQKILVLRTRTLPEQSDELARKIETMVHSFSAS